MAQDPNILGPTAGISAGNAAELLAARIAAVSEGASGPPAATASLSSEDALDRLLTENQAAANSSPAATYAEVRSLDIDAMKQARGDYAQLGLHDLAASNSPIFKDYAARVQQQARYSAGYADTPDLRLAPVPDLPMGNGPTLFDSAQHLDRLTAAELKEEYTGGGRYNEIDGEEFKGELESRRRQARFDAGYTNTLDAPTPHKESLKDILGGMDMAYAVAYGGMQTMAGVSKAVTPLLSGDAYLADQVQEQAATSFLPMAGAITGTLLGLRGGPAAGLAGQYLGQSAGQSVQEGIDTYLGGHSYAQERAGESLSVGRGGKDAADEFADALKNAVTPAAKELAEVLTKLGQSGPVAASGAAGLAPFQTSFGTAFAQTVGTEDRFLTSSPFLAGMRLQFGTDASSVSGGDYLGAAGIAAFTGDYGAMQANLGFAQAKAGRDVENPQYRKDRDFVDRFSKTEGFGQDVKDFFTGDGGQGEAYQEAKARLGYNAETGKYDMPGGEAQYSSRQDAAKAKEIASSTERLQSIFEQQQKNEADLQFSGAGADRDVSRLKVTLAGGGGAAAYRSALPGISASLSRGEGDLTQEISGLRSLETLSPQLAPYYNTLIRQDEKRAADMQAEGAGLARAGFQTQLQEEDAGFGLAVDRSTFAGRSAASRTEEYARQESYLTGVAEDPRNPLSPAERAGIESSVLKLRYGQAQAVYGEENAGLGVVRAGRDAAISRAGVLGTPEDQYGAGLAGLQSDRDQIAQNESELRRGNLTRPQILDIQRQDTQLQGDLATGPERLRVAAYDAEGGLLGNTQSAGRAELSRSASVYGAAAYTPAIFAEDDATIRLYTGAEAGSPVGSSQRARYGAERARATAEEQQDRDSSYRYGDQATRVRETQAEGAFNRDLKNPFQDGDPNADPRQAGRALEGVYQKDLGQAQAALSRTPQNSPAYEQNANAVEQLKDKISDLEERRRTAYESLIPEMLAGSPGQGRLTGILPTSGQAAFYNGNPFTTGTFGKPSRSQVYDGEDHIAQPGGVAGAFLAATSGPGSGSSGLTSSDAKALTGAIHRFVDFASRQAQGGGRSPVMTNGSTGGVNPYEFGGGR